jgi:hypothetical protein
MRRTFCQTLWTSGLFRAIRRIGFCAMALANACDRMRVALQRGTNVVDLVILPPLLGHSNAAGPGKSCRGRLGLGGQHADNCAR